MRLADTLTGVTALDGVATALTGAVQKLPARTRDALHGTWLGHPVHPMLAQVPLGLLSASAVLDVAAMAANRRRDTSARDSAALDGAAALLAGLGLASVPAAAAAGAADWSTLHPEQQRLGLVHAGANGVASVLVAASLVQRRRGRTGSGRALGLLGVGLSSLAAGLGGHLAYRWAAGPNHAEQVPHTTPPTWSSLGRLAELPEGRAVSRTVGDTPVVVVRRGHEVFALADVCSHLAGPLSQGQVVGEGGEDCIVCPWHGSSFRMRTGEVVHGPATAPQPVFEVQVIGEHVEARLLPTPGASANGSRPLGQVV